MFLDLLREGLTVRTAMRRLAVSGSTAYRWRDMCPEFAAAWLKVRSTYRSRIVRNEWPEKLIEDLEAAGFLNPDLDAKGKEELRLCVFRLFDACGLLAPRTVQKVYNNSPTPRALQMQLVDTYIKLKKDGASDNDLHRCLEIHGIGKSQISRWAKRYRGEGALHVGPFTNSATRKRLLGALALGPRDCTWLAEALDLNPITVRGQLNNLIGLGQVKKIKQGNRVIYYVCAVDRAIYVRS